MSKGGIVVVGWEECWEGRSGRWRLSDELRWSGRLLGWGVVGGVSWWCGGAQGWWGVGCVGLIGVGWWEIVLWHLGCVG